MSRTSIRWFLVGVAAAGLAAGEILAQDVGSVRGEASQLRQSKPEDRAESLAAILSRLGLGEGSVIADIGAGSGRDTWTFAELVGEKGTVFAEEIAEGKVNSLKQQAEKKDLPQVHAVLGHDDDPCLPSGSVDLAFLHHVYHHLAKPRQMLRGIRRGLKPGGYLVVVDQHRGTLRDWVPRHLRQKKHYWIAETTVVREAREEGFAFVACAEACWHRDDPFVLVFQRPKEAKKPGRDPDPFLPLPVEKARGLFLPIGPPYRRPVFVALGPARQLIGPILRHCSGEALEIVLEEWATQKQERPPLPPKVRFPSVLTNDGDPQLGSEPIDVVFFLDSYHRLFHGQTLLAKIHERLLPAGCIYVLDRQAKEPLSRREASHRRKIAPQTVQQEMAEAGFVLWFRGPAPAPDRFLLVFGKTPPDQLDPERDPFFGGPVIPCSPGKWLKDNGWRLRGLKTTDGELLPLDGPRPPVPIETVSAASAGTEIWRIPKQKLVLRFEKKDEGYVLRDHRSLGGGR